LNDREPTIPPGSRSDRDLDIRDDRIHSLVDLIYETAVDPSAWTGVLESLGAAVGTVRPVLMVYENPGGRLLFAATSRYLVPSHWPGLARGLGHGMPSSFPDEHRADTTRFIDDRRFEVQDSLHRIIVRLQTEPEDRPLAAEDHRLLDGLGSHLLRAVRLGRDFALASAQYESMMKVIDSMPFGVIFANRELEFRHGNRFAHALLGREDGLMLSAGTLTAVSPVDEMKLRQAVSWVLDTWSDPASREDPGGEVSRRVYIGRDKPRTPLSVLVSVAAQPVADTAFTRDTGLVTLIVTDPDRDLEIEPAILCDLYDLTPAEAELALAIANGVSPRKIADTREVTQETVRSQLKRVYSKTGTHRQTALVKMILLGPAGWVIGAAAQPRDQADETQAEVTMDEGSSDAERLS